MGRHSKKRVYPWTVLRMQWDALDAQVQGGATAAFAWLCVAVATGYLGFLIGRG